MESAQRQAASFAPRLIWIVWALGLAVWTYLLLAPVEWLPRWLQFGGGGISKLLTWSRIGHASAYAVLAALVPLLPIRRSGHVTLWCMLSVHACLTEFIQTFVPTRTGSWTDVATDLFGIAAGIIIGLAWARQRKATPVQAHQDAG